MQGGRKDKHDCRGEAFLRASGGGTPPPESATAAKAWSAGSKFWGKMRDMVN